MEPVGNPFQRTPNWLSDRAGLLTASRFKDALDIKQDGTPGAKRVALAKAILAERLTGENTRNYVTPAMERGIQEEPAAIRAYEARTGNIVQLCGFVRHPTILLCGASPDGLIDDDGLIEAKNPETATHVDWMLSKDVPEQHRPQLLLQLACTRRRYVDFVSYDSRIRNQSVQLLIRRFEPVREQIEESEEQAREFLAWVEQLWEQLTEAA